MQIRQRAVILGLTAPQAIALRELADPMTIGELAERMGCEPSNATFVVDKLENRQLIERRPHPTDRRARQLVLTPRAAGCAPSYWSSSTGTPGSPDCPGKNKACSAACSSGLSSLADRRGNAGVADKGYRPPHGTSGTC